MSLAERGYEMITSNGGISAELIVDCQRIDFVVKVLVEKAFADAKEKLDREFEQL